MGWFSNAIGAVVSATSAIMGVAKQTAATLVESSKKAWTDYQSNRRKARLPDAERQKSDAKDELKEVNDEILSITDKYHRTGSVSTQERERAHFLQKRRQELKNTIDGVDEINVAKDISHEPQTFEKIILDDNKAHILQGQVGVASFGKSCPRCGRKMSIQWPRSVGTAKVSDFFWGCPGWYVVKNGQHACSMTILLSNADLNIFTKTDSLEAQVSNEELTSLVLLPEPSKIITERMDDVISDQNSRHKGIESYCCPTHGEALVLRKKKQASGLLDQYFLSCSRWRPNNQGCGYMVKIKSVMQLATLLKKQTGTGVL